MRQAFSHGVRNEWIEATELKQNRCAYPKARATDRVYRGNRRLIAGESFSAKRIPRIRPIGIVASHQLSQTRKSGHQNKPAKPLFNARYYGTPACGVAVTHTG